MKDLLEQIFKHLPTYAPDLVRLIGRPKATIAELAAGTPDDLTRASIFVGVSVAIGFALQAPTLAKEHDFLTVAGGMIAFKIVCILAFSAVIFVIMRLLGGSGDYPRTLTAHLYLISPLYLTGIVLELMARGVVRSYDEDIATRLLRNRALLTPGQPEFETFVQAAPGLSLAYSALNVASVALLFGWGIACWGAFRRIHLISRLRSAIAGVLVALAMVLFVRVAYMIAIGIFGTEGMPLV
jgi:hypothetical protein